MTPKGFKTVTKSMKFDLIILDTCNQPLLIIEVKRCKGEHPRDVTHHSKGHKHYNQYKKYSDTGVAVIYCHSNQVDATADYIKNYLIPI